MSCLQAFWRLFLWRWRGGKQWPVSLLQWSQDPSHLSTTVPCLQLPGFCQQKMWCIQMHSTRRRVRRFTAKMVPPSRHVEFWRKRPQNDSSGDREVINSILRLLCIVVPIEMLLLGPYLSFIRHFPLQSTEIGSLQTGHRIGLFRNERRCRLC